jgi:heat shock protein HslJ
VVLAIAVFAAACGTADPSGLPLVGDWELVSGNDGEDLMPMVPGYRITFSSDGTTFGGTAACNTYGGTVEIEDDALRLQDLSMTEMACQPEVMASERAYLSALALIDSAGREGDVLLMSGATIELWYVLVEPIPEQELFGTIWILETLLDGETATSVEGENLTLELSEDGTLAALTGCRALNGTYVVVGDEITTTDLRADGDCPAELERQDGKVVSVLEGGFAVAIEGDRLTLTVTGGEGLVYRAG